MKITLNHFQIKSLLDLSESSGDPECYDEMTLVLVNDDSAHSGPGLYCKFEEVPENGFTFLGTDEDDEVRADAICAAKIESGEAQEI
ncbi:hypothetical protein [Pseudomonas veronii]|uniref:hypothetical protein n=1 Tax=Pseudomonas veronii TaxID=76761 RepID=UPI000F83F6D4|nr:hypothetical protein [Pseudomonas veronii]RTY63411.1 hypothetical protein EKA83_33225 [Pseudomonas veronii]